MSIRPEKVPMAGDQPKRPPGEPMAHMQGGTPLFRALNPELYMVRVVGLLSQRLTAQA